MPLATRGSVNCNSDSDPATYPVNQGVVAILGGMGSYSTLHLFEMLLNRYQVEKEWERPRIVIDNNCVLPSRVRAILYHERRAELVAGMAESFAALSGFAPDVIALPCNTAHCFLPEVREKLDDPLDKLLDMIDAVANRLQATAATKVMLVATEGTIDTRIYDTYCEPRDIEVCYPDAAQIQQTRAFIEQVKQSKDPDRHAFIRFIGELGHEHVVLGCTELSVIHSQVTTADYPCHVIDPIEVLVDRMVDTVAQACVQRPGPQW